MITNCWEISGTREYSSGVEFYSFKGAYLVRGADHDRVTIRLYAVKDATFRSGVEVKVVEEYIRAYCKQTLEGDPPVKRYADELWWKTVQKMDTEERRLAKQLLSLIDVENFELVG